MTTCRSYRVLPTDSNLLLKTPIEIEYKKEIGTTPHVGMRKINHPMDVCFFWLKANTEAQSLHNLGKNLFKRSSRLLKPEEPSD
jgi:hypothetical protein